MEAIDLLNGKTMELEQAVARLREDTWTSPSPQLPSETGGMSRTVRARSILTPWLGAQRPIPTPCHLQEPDFDRVMKIFIWKLLIPGVVGRTREG